MNFEHFGLNVPEPRAMAQWYVAHLGWTVARDVGGPTETLFLADGTGRCVMEVYRNSAAPIPAYAQTPPLCFHFALIAADARAERTRLETVGATFVEEVNLTDGSVLIMMRDPWGVPLQLCQRARPL